MIDYLKEGYSKLYDKLTNINEEISSLEVKDLGKPETSDLLIDAKNLLGIYKRGFPKKLKEKYGFNVRDLEEKIKNAEECIKILKK